MCSGVSFVFIQVLMVLVKNGIGTTLSKMELYSSDTNVHINMKIHSKQQKRRVTCDLRFLVCGFVRVNL